MFVNWLTFKLARVFSPVTTSSRPRVEGVDACMLTKV